MKKLWMLLLAAFFCVTLFAAESEKKVEVKVDGVTTQITFYSPEIVRVVKFPEGATWQNRQSLVVTLLPEQDMKITRKESASSITLSSNALSVVVDKKSGLVQFLQKGKNLLKESAYDFKLRENGEDKGSFRTMIRYQLDKDEPIYGLGAIQDGKMNRRNSHFRMME
ncbi:MAG: DUF4968 domain-containing protein, partial [Alistipes sp.]|nr:DUF4968 domain-containing protein [Alistipes sp.]